MGDTQFVFRDGRVVRADAGPSNPFCVCVGANAPACEDDARRMAAWFEKQGCTVRLLIGADATSHGVLETLLKTEFSPNTSLTIYYSGSAEDERSMALAEGTSLSDAALLRAVTDDLSSNVSRVTVLLDCSCTGVGLALPYSYCGLNNRIYQTCVSDYIASTFHERAISFVCASDAPGEMGALAKTIMSVGGTDDESLLELLVALPRTQAPTLWSNRQLFRR